MTPAIHEIKYVASPTLKKFHKSPAFVRGIRGPIGSGKSVGCCMEVFRRMQEQEPGRDGKRRSRWAIIRNTYPELETTTIKTWLDWFPERIFGRLIKRAPICHEIRYNDIEAEVYFLAMDKPDDVKKLLSLELTGGWPNEARELGYEIITTLCDRVGRYPAQKDRPEHIEPSNWPTWYGVIMDTNSPDEDHWWPVCAGDAELPEDWTPPTNWELFAQPPAAFEEKSGEKTVWRLNPDAENLPNLPPNYYKNLIQGRKHSHIRVYVGNKYGTVSDGKQVYPEWSEDLHLSQTTIPVIPGRTVYVGLDFGQTPAACFGQSDARGQWRDLHEIVTEGLGPKRFARILRNEIASKFPGMKITQFEFYGDPSGAFPTGNADETYFEILKAEGFNIRPAPTQNPTTRQEAGREPLERMLAGGTPGYQIDPSCKTLIRGFRAGYQYKRLKVSGSVKYDDKPDKNRFSHVHEARQYMLCGAGYGRDLRKRGNWEQNKGEVLRAKTKFSVLK